MGVLFTIEPKDLRRAQRIIAAVGEDEFRRAVHEMTQFDTEALSLDDVICVYVLALEGRVQPPGPGDARWSCIRRCLRAPMTIRA